MSLESDNWPSNLEHSDEVSRIIWQNIEYGHMAGSFPSLPPANFHCSPLSVMAQKSGGICIINDLSWTVKKSINEFVSPDDFSLSYMSVNTAVRHIQLFVDPYINKQDIASAFTHIIVHPSDWYLLGFKWQNNYDFSKCLVFRFKFRSHVWLTSLHVIRV